MFVTPVAPIVNISSGGGAAWGAITGTLSDQTDLQSALDAQTSYTDTVIAAHIAAADPHPQYLIPAEADASYASLVRTLTGTLSITGGGSLAADRTFSLVNDSATPGNSKLYGTDATGVKGWYAQPTGGGGALSTLTDVAISAPANNQILKYVSATSKWTNSAAIDGVTVGATTAASGSFTSLKCTSWDNATPIFGAANRGLVPVTGSPTGKFLKDDGTWATPAGSGTPGGANTQIQFNTSGVFDGDAELTWDTTTKFLTVTGNAKITGYVEIDSNIGIGAAALTTKVLTLTATTTGGASQAAIDINVTANSSATGSLYGFNSQLNTAAAAFTCPIVSNFRVLDAIKGTGSTITDQVGVFINDLTVGINNYGAKFLVSSGANKWNIYASGTAKNHFNGTVLVGTTADNGTDKVQITGTLHVSGGFSSTTPIFDATHRGLVPATVSSTGKFLKDDGTWATITPGSTTLAGLTDVLLTAPANNEFLVYESASGKWKNKSGLEIITLTGLSDVAISSPATNDVLKYNGSSWVNGAVSAAPGGSNTQVQFNDSSAFNGDAGFLFDKTTDILTVLGGFSSTTPVGVKYNLVDNSEFLIAQRPVATLSATGFIADRYQVTISGTGTIAWAVQASDNPRFANHLRLTVGTADSSIAAGDLYTLQHAVEGLDCSFIKFGSANAIQLTLSFEVRCSMTGTFGVSFSNSANNRGYVGTFTINSANTWETKTITLTAGDTTGTWLTDTNEGLRLRWCLASGNTGQTATINAWQASGTVYTTSAQTQWISTAGATFDITGINLTPAPVAWPYIHEKYKDVLTKCLRYLPAFISPSTFGVIGTGFFIASTIAVVNVLFPVTAIKAPTGILISNSTHFSATDGVGDFPSTSTIFNSAGFVGGAIQLTVTGATAFRSNRGSFNTVSAYLLFIGAEI